MKHFTFEIKGEQFEKNYIVYVITITHNKVDKYFYVGQTGDRFHETARPAFRRIAGHFGDQGSLTDNRVYRAIAFKILKLIDKRSEKKFSSEVKNHVTEFLINSEIKVDSFIISKYDFKDTSNHKSNRDIVEKIEDELLGELIEQFGFEHILNHVSTKHIKKSKSQNTNEIIKTLGFSKNKIEEGTKLTFR